MLKAAMKIGFVTATMTGLAAVAAPNLSAQEIVAPSARTLFNRASLVRSFVEIDHSSLKEKDESSRTTRYVPVLAVVYGFHPNWSVIVVQPYVGLNATSRAANEIRKEDFSGFGDTQLLVQYDGLFKRNSPGGLTRLSGVFGLQIPTGSHAFSTGAVEYTGGLVFEKAVRLKYVFTGDFEYTLATRNGRGFSVGDRARFDAVPAYFIISTERPGPGAGSKRRLYDRVFRHGAYLILEFNGEWQSRASNSGIAAPDTGGTRLSVSPGIQYFVNDRFLVEFSSPIPAATYLNGKQAAPGPTLLLGFRYLF